MTSSKPLEILKENKKEAEQKHFLLNKLSNWPVRVQAPWCFVLENKGASCLFISPCGLWEGQRNVSGKKDGCYLVLPVLRYDFIRLQSILFLRQKKVSFDRTQLI